MGQQLLMMVFAVSLCSIKAVIDNPRIYDFSAYIREGDVNIGHLANIRQDEGCNDTIDIHSALRVEQLAHVVSVINNASDILPNITLGFVVLDACQSDLNALARAVYFLNDNSTIIPNTTSWVDYPGDEEMVIPGSDREKDLFGSPRQYDIAGLVGLATTRQTINVAALMSAFKIPMVSQSATSDELSDRSRFPQFMRVVPPDRFLAEALIDIAINFNWSYVSLVYSEGSYGEHGAKQTQNIIRTSSVPICVAYMHRISSVAGELEYLWVVDKLLKHRKARVVILFCEEAQQVQLMKAVKARGLSRFFLFLISDVFVGSEEANEGAIYVSHHTASVPGYRDFLKKITPLNNPANPWMPYIWEVIHNCTRPDPDRDDNYTQCYDYEIPPTLSWLHGYGNSRIYDAVYLLAHGFHKHIMNSCPEQLVSVDKQGLRACLSGDKLMNAMLNVTFDGLNGKIAFDNEGNMLGQYVLLHYTRLPTGHYVHHVVGEWNKLNELLFINMSRVNWTIFQDEGLRPDPFDIPYIPESVCSKPCDPGQYYVIQEITCCWQCQDCRNNEIVSQNLSMCIDCPLFTWPNQKTFTDCLPISPQHLQPTDPVGVVLLLFGVIGIVGSLYSIGVLWAYRKHRLIRATSRELSFIILLGTLLASASMWVFVVKPTQVTCLIRVIAFHYSFNLLYSPMLVKTVRIFRIFNTGKRAVKRPKFVSSFSQMVFTLILVMTETLLVLSVELSSPVTAVLKMPVIMEEHVELVCEQTKTAFLLPLNFNLTLILVCLVLGYISRKLPENFNESRYIFVSVSTTLFAWIVFFPVYFTAFYAVQQVILLAFCLLLNAYITVGLLFAPKIYAIYFVKDTQIKFRFNDDPSSSGRVVPIQPDMVKREVKICERISEETVQQVTSSQYVEGVSAVSRH